MRVQCYKPMPDEARALTASPKLSAIYLHVPLHLSPLFPPALGPGLLLFPNTSVRALPLSTRISFSIHHFFPHVSVLHPLALTPSALLFVIPNDESEKCQKCPGHEAVICR